MNICIYGAASKTLDEKYIKAVENLGYILAKRNHGLIFGGGRNGLMGAAARGVTKGGGKIQGVIPSFFKEENIEGIYDKCDELIFTETMAQRKAKMEDLADAFVIVPGGIGTFEELFEVLTLKQLGRHNKAIVFYDIKDYYVMIEKLLEKGFEERFIRDDCIGKICNRNVLLELILRDLCQSLDIRTDLEKARIVRLDRLNARLLEHDLGKPDAVRILGMSPRQVALVFAVPLQEGVDGLWGEMIFHVRFLFISVSA